MKSFFRVQKSVVPLVLLVLGCLVVANIWFDNKTPEARLVELREEIEGLGGSGPVVVLRFEFTGDRDKISHWTLIYSQGEIPWSDYQGQEFVEVQIDRPSPPSTLIKFRPVIKLLDGTIIEGHQITWAWWPGI